MFCNCRLFLIAKYQLINIINRQLDRPDGDRGSGRPFENHMAIGFLRNTGTDPYREVIRPLGGSNCFSSEVLRALCEIC